MSRGAGPDSAAPRRLVPRWLTVGASYLIAGALAAAVLGSFVPFPNVPDITQRYRLFEEKKDSIDTLFIGSSRFRHQVIPPQFDEATAAAEVPTHSLNLGFSGMWPPESFYFLHRLLALHPRHLRWVFIELMDHRFGPVENEPITLRQVYWHDWPHTLMAWRLDRETPMDWSTRARLWMRDTGMFLRRSTHLGAGAEFLQERSAKSKKAFTGWSQKGGFEAEPEGGVWSDASRVEFQQMIDRVKTGHPAQSARPGYAAALQQVIREVHAAGATPIFVLAPTVRPEEFLARDLPEGLTLWAFNDPDRYPALYDADLHYDPGHLNERGAREFTRLLAERLIALRKSSTFSSAIAPSK